MTPGGRDEDPAGGVAPALQSTLDVLATSVGTLATLVHALNPTQLRQSAYPSEWTVADVLSHLGSGAVITQQTLDGEADAPSVWDEWNAKSPDTQAADALLADAALQARLASITDDEAATMRLTIGPMELDLPTFLSFRINEHVVHTWDVAVTFDDSAVIAPAMAEYMVDHLDLVADFAGKPTGAERDFSIRTEAPTRFFEISLRSESVGLAPGAAMERPDLELPSDALIRLVYGRLDPQHTPAVTGDGSALEELRKAFPGF